MNYKTIKRLKVRSFYFLGFAFFIALLSACVGDSILSEEDRLSSNEAYAELLLKSSGTENSQNKVEYDRDINSLTVLVFKHDEGKNPVFAYKAPVSAIKKQENGKFLVSTKLKISQTEDDKYSLALIANEEISDADLASYKGFPKETLIKKLNFQSTHLDKQDYFWKDKFLPMYGESEPKYISKVPQVWGTIYMIRSVAKVTIDIQSNDQNLVFGELYIHNAVSKGRYASDVHLSFLDDNTPTPSNTKVTLPDFNTNETQYTNWVKFVDVATQSATPIILAENEGGLRDDVDKTTCFVLGLKKDENSEISYYRLDIPKMLENEKFDEEKTEPILRNRHYLVTVNKVEGDGADNKDDALKKEVEIDCTVQIGEWNLLENEYEFEDTSDNLENNHCLDFQNGSGKKIFVEDGKTEFTVEFSLFKDDWKRLFITEKNNGLFKISSITKAEAKADGSTKKAKEKITLKVKILDNAKFQEDGPHLPFTIGLTKHENDNNNSLSGTTLTIENKPTDESPSFMQTDVEVYGPTFESIPIPPNSENFKAKIFGKYVKGKDSEKNHYIEVTIKEDAIPNDFFTYAKIYTNEVNGYKFQPKENIDKSLLNGIYTIKVPCSGTFIKAGVDHFTLNFKYDSPMLKVNYYMPITNEVFAEDLEEPIAENLRILVVAADYVFHDNKQEFFPYRNLGRILRGEKNFSLLKFPKEEENETAVRVAPFEFRYCTMRYKWNFDETPRNIVYWADNLQEVETLFNLDQDEYIKKWMDFDIILYVRSNNPTDLNEGYVSYMQEFLNKPGKVLIQTPSKRRRGLSLGNGEYEEKLLKDSEAKRGMKVYGSSYIFKNQRLVKGVNSVDTETDLYKSTTILGFPEKDKEEDVISQDVRYRDFNYTTLDYDAKGYKVLGRLDIVKEIDIIDGDYPVMLSSTTKNRNHIWIGSSYFFADVAFGATKSGVPVDKYLTEYKGLIKGERELVANSKYFMNLMNWAIHKTKEGTETTK